MTRLLHRNRANETFIPCATAQPAPAAHLGRRRDRDRRIGFDDVAAMPDPEWSRPEATKPEFCPGQFLPEALVPAGQMATVPLPDPVAEEMAGLTAAIGAMLTDRPDAAGTPAVHMVLAPLMAELAASAPDTSWNIHLEQLAELTPLADAVKAQVA